MKKKNVLSVKNLSKNYSKNNSEPINALKNLNLDVQQGEIFGLLGPNGCLLYTSDAATRTRVGVGGGGG